MKSLLLCCCYCLELKDSTFLCRRSFTAKIRRDSSFLPSPCFDSEAFELSKGQIGSKYSDSFLTFLTEFSAWLY